MVILVKGGGGALSAAVAAAKADLANLEALLPVLAEHASRRPGVFGRTVEDDDQRALEVVVGWLGDLHDATEALAGVLARGPVVAGGVAGRLPALGLTGCDRCGRPPRDAERFRQRLCTACYGRLARWRTARGNAGGTVAEWMVADAARRS